MSSFALALGVAVFLSAAMSVAWRVAMSSNKSGRVDAIWSFATGAAGVAAAVGGGLSPRALLVAAMAAIWSIRLGGYLWRRAESGEEDPRYAALKKQWGASASRRLWQFLQIQAVAAWPLAAAAFAAAHGRQGPLTAADALGLAIFALSFVGEAVADRQMAAFKHDPANKGRICELGLWSWSRHPNYFFEWATWLAYSVLAFSSTSWLWTLALIAPIEMYVLLVYVSGVPPLEQHLKRSRPEAFRDYASRVSLFWPWPPGKSAR